MYVFCASMWVGPDKTRKRTVESEMRIKRGIGKRIREITPK